ncbi:hypothetical protein M902_3077 [Bacteriovorax sp. BAL6_X]|uniref:hypothetical protein n=1 Tax=Bacteriovorax sp. BAL6_X TaxID=1201290 RepID=UPI000385F8A6|nr:hypothetical protein [Bacteriovorax sp. BAL6_X]EPZ50990.1 hypothetical protein M902_3077 [Bacteriovorax sp. BAL6_X]
MTNLDKYSCIIAYSGSAVDDGTMDMLTLGRSLTRLGSMLNVAISKYAQDVDDDFSVKFTNSSEGSIELLFDIVKYGFENYEKLNIAGFDFYNLSSVIMSLGLCSSDYKNVFDYILHLNGEKPKSVTKKGDNYYVVNSEGVRNVYNNCTFNMANDSQILTEIAGVVAPVLDIDH